MQFAVLYCPRRSLTDTGGPLDGVNPIAYAAAHQREEKTAGEYIQTVLLSIPIGRTFRACLGKLIHSDRFVATILYLVLLVVVSCCAVVRMN
jgi:hypothetical protein